MFIYGLSTDPESLGILKLKIGVSIIAPLLWKSTSKIAPLENIHLASASTR